MAYGEAGLMPPFLELHDAIVRRGGRDLLHVDAFRLDEGESIALLGPNGAGKSTFIRLLTREIHPLYRDRPPLLYRGHERFLLTELRRSMGMVSSTMQDQITVHLPSIEIVLGGLFGTLGLPHGLKASEDEYKRALKAMAVLGIEQHAEHDAMALSSGEARRVLIARALIHDPEVLVFDEPCTGLDPEGMYYVRRSMRNLIRDGRSIVLVTHYPEDVIPEIERLVMIKEGRIFADGPKDKLLNSAAMSELFEVPLIVEERDGYYALLSHY